MIRIAVHLGKGGTGKTTTSWALSSFLSRQERVLAVDLDPQSTLASALLTDATCGAHEVLTKTASIAKSLTPASPSYAGALSVLAGSHELSSLEQETTGDLDRHYCLRDALDEFGDGADFTIIDTPPGSASILTVASLVAATHVLTPVSLDAAAFEQLPSPLRLIHQVRRRLNPELKWLGVLPMRYDRRRRFDNEVLEALKVQVELVHPPVPESVRVKEAMGQGDSAITVAPLFDPAIESIMRAVCS